MKKAKHFVRPFLAILFLTMMVGITNASAQTYYGYLTKNVDGYRKGEAVMYQKTRSGKIQLPGGAEYGGAYPATIVQFSGYYIGEIIDPVDNYVNVRKGPGTQYPVVRKVHTKEWCIEHEMDSSLTDSGRFYYQKTSNNWWKLYDKPGKFIGYIYFNRIDQNVSPEYY